jgi:hypothetical protein
MLDAAAAMYDAVRPWDHVEGGSEGPRARVTIAPGAVGVKRTDPARRERTGERELRRRGKRVDELAAHLVEHGELPDPPAPRREITGWSRKSRRNMVLALCEIDYLPMFTSTMAVPAMVTLTYPGDWLTVAPNGRAVKEHLQEFFHRYRRSWGTDLLCIWKLEFQRRGAPHFHLMLVPPRGRAHSRSDAAGSGLEFKHWLSVVWADIVDHPDPIEYQNHLAAGTGVDYEEGARLQDPRRAAVYFTKHGSFRAKEYQHCVPDQWRGPGDGPGRFWGYRQLHRVPRSVEVTPYDAILIARTIRRWARAQGTTREVLAPRVKGGRPQPASWDVVGLAGAQLLASRGAVRHRRVRRRVQRLRNGAGWVSVNDGAAFASALARYLSQVKAAAHWEVRRLMADRIAYA